MENVVRKDLNDIVTKIKFEEVGSKNYKRMVCNVTLFTGKVIEFADKEGIYDLFVSYQACGEKDFIKSIKLVEEEKKNLSLASFDAEDDDKSNTFFCVLYELKNGQTFRLFPAKKFTRQIIENYYNLYKTQQKAQAKQTTQTK